MRVHTPPLACLPPTVQAQKLPCRGKSRHTPQEWNPSAAKLSSWPSWKTDRGKQGRPPGSSSTSARLELDNETDEDEISDEDDVEEVMQPNTIRMKPGDYGYHRHYGDTVDGLNVERLEDSVVGSKFL